MRSSSPARSTAANNNKGRRHGNRRGQAPNSSGYAVNVFNKTGGKSYTIVDGDYPRRGSRQLAGSTPAAVEESAAEKETWQNDKHWDIQHTESEELPQLPFLF